MTTHRSVDVWILASVTGLLGIGFLNILGNSPQLAPQYAVFALLGIIGGSICYFSSIRGLRDNFRVILVTFFMLFVVTSLFGEDIRGSKRWLDLYFFNFQTSEFYKPFFILSIAEILSRQTRTYLQNIILATIIGVISIFFIFIQPDLDTAILYAVTLCMMIYFSGVSTYTIIRFLIAGVLALPAVWFLLKDYQRARIIGFLNTSADPQGLTYNINQSIIAVGAGGFFGRGLGLGTQARFQFLPEHQTDFAFASLVEQFGFIGGILTILCFFILLFRIVRKALEKRSDTFSFLFLGGIALSLFISIFVNIGMNMGILPVTGIALPFISYGGSSVVSTLLMIGLALAI